MINQKRSKIEFTLVLVNKRKLLSFGTKIANLEQPITLQSLAVFRANCIIRFPKARPYCRGHMYIEQGV